jgi:hypothetical protein
MQRWGVWKYDLSNPHDIHESHLEHAEVAKLVPESILDALRRGVDIPGANLKPAASTAPAR